MFSQIDMVKTYLHCCKQKPMRHLKVFFWKSLSKATFEKTFRCGIHTCTIFYLQKSTFRNRTSSIPESFLKQTVSCEPVIGQSETSDYNDRNFMVIILCMMTEIGIFV